MNVITTDFDAPDSRTPRHPAIVTRDGLRLFHKDWGDGAPILFVHAWSMSSDFWEYQMAPLASQGFRCIAFDRRGNGRSEDNGRGYSLDALADDLAGVIEQLDLSELDKMLGEAAAGGTATGEQDRPTDESGATSADSPADAADAGSGDATDTGTEDTKGTGSAADRDSASGEDSGTDSGKNPGKDSDTGKDSGTEGDDKQ